MASFKLVVIIFALLIGSILVNSQRFGEDRCGRHEHFERCGKPIRCQRSCGMPGGERCSERCVPRCMCNGDRVRNRFNECVHFRDCRGGRHF